MTYELVAAAVAAQTAEADDLDWKAVARTDEAARVELAKDLAAMANSGGGLLVVGVAESGEGAELTVAMSDIALTPQLEQQVLSVNAQRVQPMIEGVEVHPLPNPETAGAGVLAVYIPPSPDAPHFVGRPDGTYAAPRRNGPHTVWLREREIERAYADRFSRRSAEAERLDRVLNDTKEHLLGSVPWVIGAAVPRNPRASLVINPTAEHARNAIARGAELDHQTMWQDTGERSAHGQTLAMFYSSLVGVLRGSAQDPRRGLRRWVVRHEHDDLRVSGLTDDAYVELHHDGSVAFAYPPAVRAQTLVDQDPTASFIRLSFVEMGATSVVGLASAWAELLGVTGPIAVELAIVGRRDAEPSLLKALSVSTMGGFNFGEHVAHGSTALLQAEPAVSELLDPTDRDDRRATALQLAEDVVHQFGVGRLELMTEHNQ
ncbi:ATP-binding protein [Cellulomonas sp. JH27-2]|uniref:ATP-binding protein n=1 Tax=Cellulomonas sp. JH27-2 TaxID=2774139 RepID=UPI0017863E82|nr:ATP-binding protein [Cellulomonas sp. JH27-2]MBD8057840.1 ATP-binding protein [Cellulomonas sp. JH27-2]